MHNRDALKELLEKHLSNELSGYETLQFLHLIQQEENRSELADMIEAVLQEERYREWPDSDKQRLFEMVLQKALDREPEAAESFLPATVHPLRRWIPYAAALIMLMGAGTWYFITRSKELKRHEVVSRQIEEPKQPATTRNKVLLTLADGSLIALDDMEEGAVGRQKGVNIVKTGDGEIAYKFAGLPLNNKMPAYNTISTPRGGQYHIILPDGTGVWLNAASSLKFPVAFSAKDRSVKLTGEAYFEVAPDGSRPFIVSARDIMVNVLGTHFNVMAYSDEAKVKTTLLEGSVKLSSTGADIILKPGQQGSLTQNAQAFSVSRPDMEQVMAWKNGEFRFENTRVEAIMRHIERWYDVSVVYEGNIADISLSGIISRKEKVSQLLEILEATRRVHFKIENNRITVMPYSRKR